MYFGLKQGQITPNIKKLYVLKLIHLVAQCSKITNTVLFLKRILHDFSAFYCLQNVTSECPKVHFVALRFIYHDKFHDESKMRNHRMSKLPDDGDPWVPNNLLTPEQKLRPQPTTMNSFISGPS